jgi:AMMECR1 domain-containing protein
MKYMEDEELPLANPSKWFPAFEWSQSRAPNGLHPATLARLAIAEYLSSGKLLRAPERLDAEYDSAGGAWVSIRSRTDVHHRYAREGFWHFPDEAGNSAAEDVMLASLRTAIELPPDQEGLKILGQSGIAVTFFSGLQRCTVGQLDNDRYGIVVRSLERPSTMGGALPRMPGIRNEWEQFQHARRKNGQLISFEPFEILRHDLVKAVEPQTDWQPTGVPAAETPPWYRTENICGRIAQRARDFVIGRLFELKETTCSLPDDLIPDEVDSIYVTIYLSGRLSGCMGSGVRKLDDDLRRLANAAVEDDRFGSQRPNSPSAVAVTVSVLFNPLELGEAAADEIQPYYKCGEQALMVYRGEQLGLLLPFVAATYNLDSQSFAQAVVEKSGLTEPSNYWCRLDAVTWLADERQTVELFCGFPNLEPREAAEKLADYANWHSDYLVRHQRADGSFCSTYEPCQDEEFDEHTLSRSAHAAWVAVRGHKLLSRADLLAVAEKAIERILTELKETEDDCWLGEGENASVSEIAFFALTLCNLPESNRRRAFIYPLGRTLWSAARQTHGRIKTHRDPSADDDLFQDYYPGQVLLALAALSQIEPDQIDLESLQRCFKFYRHRFRYRRHFGQVSWLMQAFASWWQITGDSSFAEFVFEVGDWLVTYQQEKTGGFINDHQPDSPGYTTAVYLEGIAAALRLAAQLDDRARYRKYQRSFMEGFRFLDRLILQPRDASVLPNFELSSGGVRESLYSSRVRLDFVQHSLSAILEYRSSETQSLAAGV